MPPTEPGSNTDACKVGPLRIRRVNGNGIRGLPLRVADSNPNAVTH